MIFVLKFLLGIYDLMLEKGRRKEILIFFYVKDYRKEIGMLYMLELSPF